MFEHELHDEAKVPESVFLLARDVLDLPVRPVAIARPDSYDESVVVCHSISLGEKARFTVLCSGTANLPVGS